MGLGSRLKNMFRKERTEDIPELPKPDIPKFDVSDVKPRTDIPRADIQPATDTTKAKLDLVVAHIEGLKVQYENINARIERIEMMLAEIYAIAKR